MRREGESRVSGASGDVEHGVCRLRSGERYESLQSGLIAVPRAGRVSRCGRAELRLDFLVD
jgi:hypothetical protein